MTHNSYEIENGKFESNKSKFSVVGMAIWCETPEQAVAVYEELQRDAEERYAQRQAYVAAVKTIASNSFTKDDVVKVFGDGSTVSKKKIECAAAALGLKWKKINDVVKKCKVAGINGSGSKFYYVDSAVNALRA